MGLCAQTMRAHVGVNGSGQWWTHRAVPRNHWCCHWRPRHAVSRNHWCCHWRPRHALSPSHRQFWTFHFSEFSTSCPNSHPIVMLYQFILTFSLWPFCAHVLHRGNTSFEVWHLQLAKWRDWSRVIRVIVDVCHDSSSSLLDRNQRVIDHFKFHQNKSKFVEEGAVDMTVLNETAWVRSHEPRWTSTEVRTCTTQGENKGRKQQRARAPLRQPSATAPTRRDTAKRELDKISILRGSQNIPPDWESP